MSNGLMLAHTTAQNDGDELMQICLPEYDHNSTVMRLSLSELGCKSEMSYEHWFHVVYIPNAVKHFNCGCLETELLWLLRYLNATRFGLNSLVPEN